MNAIELKDLVKYFGKEKAVSNLNLKIPFGRIFSFLGPNGAGKTTTIKAMLNIIAASSGSAKVLGTNSSQLGPKEFVQIGYVSENQRMPEWMTIKRYLSYCATYYPKWDKKLEKNLIDKFALPPDQKIKKLSRGMRMKTALVSSLVYHPKLLVLDEPFSGLDPYVREEFVTGLLEVTKNEKWTIFLSSHDIDEVERLADTVAIINKGQVTINEDFDSLQKRFCQIDITFRRVVKKIPELPPSFLNPQLKSRSLSLTADNFHPKNTRNELKDLLPPFSGFETTGLSLKEIFIVLSKKYKLEASLIKGGK